MGETTAPALLEDGIDAEYEWNEDYLEIKRRLLEEIPEYATLDETDQLCFIRAYVLDGYEEVAKKVKGVIKYRKEVGFDSLFEQSFPEQNYNAVTEAIPLCIFGMDREGHPTLFIKANEIKEEIAIQNLNHVHLFWHRVFKHIRSIPESISKKYDKKVFKYNCVIDVNGIGVLRLNKVWELIKPIMVVGGDRYPERLNKLLICNTGFTFRFCWQVIRPFVHERTQKKISMKGSDYMKKLKLILNEDQIPTDFKGKATAKFKSGAIILSPQIGYPFANI